MALLQVLSVPDPRLRLKAVPVELVDNVVQKLMDDMVETMYEEEGCGLAATQVGVLKRVIVVDVSWKVPRIPLLRMANPEILCRSDALSVCQEGCLSVPGQRAEVKRPEKISIRYLDENNQSHEWECDGFLATCLQHEIDHLDGKLYIDYVSPLKRSFLLKKAIKFKEDALEGKEKKPGKLFS